ncbi:MAG TPA: hypothetical protein VKT77_18160, partial [Chthonomonadaceae bacterium]|nr:hypothetical protein [Chthonomonadaceae bacterium]
MRSRLMIWNIAAVAVLLAILGGIVQVTIDRVLLGAVDSDLEKSSAGLLGQAHEFLLRDRGVDDGQRHGPHGPPPGPRSHPSELNFRAFP